jgi:hypothetical protein
MRKTNNKPPKMYEIAFLFNNLLFHFKASKSNKNIP